MLVDVTRAVQKSSGRHASRSRPSLPAADRDRIELLSLLLLFYECA
jgi:hypothetical protein